MSHPVELKSVELFNRAKQIAGLADFKPITTSMSHRFYWTDFDIRVVRVIKNGCSEYTVRHRNWSYCVQAWPITCETKYLKGDPKEIIDLFTLMEIMHGH